MPADIYFLSAEASFRFRETVGRYKNSFPGYRAFALSTKTDTELVFLSAEASFRFRETAGRYKNNRKA